MSNSDAILYTMILWSFLILSKIWFPHIETISVEVQP